MKTIFFAFIYILTTASPLLAMDEKDKASSGNRFMQKPNRFMNRENPFLKPKAKQSLPAQNSTLPQPVLDPYDTTPKSIDDMMKLIDGNLDRLMSENSSAEERAEFLKQLQDGRMAQDAAFEKEKSVRKAAHEKQMAALDAQIQEQQKIHDARMAPLNARLAAQEIQFAKERAEQKVASERQDAELAAQDVAFKLMMARLRAQHQLP